MKKVGFFLIIIIVLLVSSCQEEQIELTLSNYETYIDVATYVNENHGTPTEILVKHPVDDFPGYDFMELTMYDNLTFGIKINGVSQNFNYYDVVVTGEFAGKTSFYEDYLDFGTRDNPKGLGDDELLIDQPIQCTVTAKGNIARNGTGETIYDCPIGKYTSIAETQTEFKITNVSGYVVPAKSN